MTDRQYFDIFAERMIGPTARELSNALLAVVRSTGVTLADFRRFSAHRAGAIVAAANRTIEQTEPRKDGDR